MCRKETKKSNKIITETLINFQHVWSISSIQLNPNNYNKQNISNMQRENKKNTKNYIRNNWKSKKPNIAMWIEKQ